MDADTLHQLYAQLRKLPCAQDRRVAVVQHPDPAILDFSIAGLYHPFHVFLNKDTMTYSVQQRDYTNYNQKLICADQQFKSVKSFLNHVVLVLLHR